MFYKANDKYSATLTAGYTVGQTTLSVNVVPDNVPTLVCVAKGTTKETIFIVTGKTTSSLTGVSRLKGYSGDLDAQMPVTCLNNSEFINQYSAAVSTPESFIQIFYGIDGGSTDAYEVSLDVAPTAYTAGLTVAFKANTANTGACSLNLNSLGAKAIKLQGEDLGDNTIKSGQIVTVVYDGIDFQLQSAGGGGVRLSWYLDGTEIVRNEAGMKFIAPADLTVKHIKAIVTSGTATIRLQKGTTDIASGISVSSTLSDTTSFSDASISAGEIITLDITAASSPVGMIVMMECS